jgi:hypothetical protein
MLSESEKWHADGTFHTKAKYFGQLYTFHAYFPISKYDENIDRVWVKRMIPCARLVQECLLSSVNTTDSC